MWTLFPYTTLFRSVITTQNPSTMLKMHEDAVVVIDRELADAVGYRA